MEKGTLILIVCVIFGLGLFMVSKLGCFIKESRKELSDERSNLQLLKKVEMSSKGRKKNAYMHVIPGTVMPETGQKQKFKLHIETPSVKDYILTVSIFIGCTLIGLIFQKLYFTDANIVTIYILGVLLTSILTDGYLCSLAGSFLSVVLFCFFLTEPRMSFQTYAVGYPVTFLIMLISSVLTGTLAAKLKEHARLSAQQAFCTQILFDTNRLLQQVKDRRDILCVTCKQLVRLLNCNIVAYIEENGELSGGSLFFHNDERGRQGELLTSEEQYVARWAYENGQNAGATTNHFSSARCLYFVIKSGDNVYGVIGIPLQKKKLDSYENSILISVLNECALTMENSHNAIKYTLPGSKICIRGIKKDGKAQISVADNGPGISDEVKPHIFEMFYTGNNTIADSHRSLGLGLALCRSIIEAHGGTLVLTDNIPRGCIFTFTLPLSEVILNE